MSDGGNRGWRYDKWIGIRYGKLPVGLIIVLLVVIWWALSRFG